MATGFANSTARVFLLKMLALQCSKEKGNPSSDWHRLQKVRCKKCSLIYSIVLLAVHGHLWCRQAAKCSISRVLELHGKSEGEDGLIKGILIVHVLF